jgi:hypothetical protein
LGFERPANGIEKKAKLIGIVGRDFPDCSREQFLDWNAKAMSQSIETIRRDSSVRIVLNAIDVTGGYSFSETAASRRYIGK